MKILIATGIYPPKTSGPAQYAKHMEELWAKMGHEVSVKTYTIENKLPTGVRHLWYFFKILPSLVKSDLVFALDTYSVGFPSVLAARIFNKKIIIRTGGDFLWEGYVERTGDLVLLGDFYITRMNKLSLKERIIFIITKWTLRNTSLLVFSTEWQRNIFSKPYEIDESKVRIVENHYDKKESTSSDTNVPKEKNFVAGVRPLKWKNIDLIKKVFNRDEIKSKGAFLDTKEAPYEKFMDKMAGSYAVVLMSLGDISPHMILDAINHNKPFILTQENGLMNRVGDIAITADPKNEDEIAEKVLWLMDEENYKNQVEKIKNFSFVHTWQDIAGEYMELYKTI